MKRRVLVLCGGKSSEHEVSLVSALSVCRALDPQKFDVQLVGVDRNGRWLTPAETSLLVQGRHAARLPGVRDLEHALDSSEHQEVSLMPSLNQAALADVHRGGAGFSARKSSGGEFDVVLPIIHGRNGEDGTLQGLLDLAGLPYVGSGVLGSAVGMDKDVTKRLLREAGIPVTPSLTVRRHQWDLAEADVLAAAEREFGYPYFVKPANSGSSVGVHKVKSRESASAAFLDAFIHDRKVLVEKAIHARELECAVLGNEHPRASVVGEILPTHEFYDYEAKYVDENGAILKVPAEIPTEIAERMRALSVEAFTVLECEGMARVDFFWDKDEPDKIYLNEINTIPGFTPISMYPRLWEATGIPYSELLETLIDLALDRHAKQCGK